MKHGILRGSFDNLLLVPNAKFTHGGNLNIAAHQTYRFAGYKESIIEFLVQNGMRDRVIKLRNNTSTDEYGTGFEPSNLFVVFSKPVTGPTTMGGAVVWGLQGIFASPSMNVITGTVSALGQAGKTVVNIYKGVSAVDKIVSTQFDFKAKLTQLIAKNKTAYHNPVFRQFHHALNSRILVDLRAYADNKTLKRASTVINTGHTAITCGALAVLIDEKT